MLDTQPEETKVYSSSVNYLLTTDTAENDQTLSNRFNSHDNITNSKIINNSDNDDILEYETSSGSSSSIQQTSSDNEQSFKNNKDREEAITEEINSIKSDSHVTDDNNDRMCRICFSGPEDEDNLGRLISPCRCKGSMRYVHVECLNRWRLRSLKRTSFFQCDECKYKYAFRRTTIAKYVTNESKIFFYFYPPVSEDLLFNDDGDIADEGAATTINKEMFTTSNLFTIDSSHLILGIMFVGLVGFIQILISIMWFGPFPTLNTYRLGTGGGGGGRINGRVDIITTAFISIIILLGVLKAFWGMYKMVKSASRKILERVELTILEVNEAAS
nr:12015_t:CDS:2 [Entrophospora candida]